MTAMKAAVRVNALALDGPGHRTLKAMEDHGKRLDEAGKSRRIRDEAPLVHKTLDLRRAFDAHVAGAKMNAGLKKPVLHMIVQFPDQLRTDAAPEPFLQAGGIEERKRLMLTQAIKFAQNSHGGDAVFAGRVDRDEAGELTVDLFLAPKYEKITKTGKSSGFWISTTKHGKELAETHQEEIKRRHPKAREGKRLTGPRQVGIALQEQFGAFFLAENGVQLTRKLKERRGPDRLEVEAFKVVAAEREALAIERSRAHTEAQAQAEEIKAVAEAEAEAKAKEIRDAAEAEAEAIRTKARAEAQEVLDQAARDRAQLDQEKERLDQERAVVERGQEELTSGFTKLGELRFQLKEERRELSRERKEVARVLEALKGLGQRVLDWLMRAGELPKEMKAEGKGLLREMEQLPADDDPDWPSLR